MTTLSPLSRELLEKILEIGTVDAGNATLFGVNHKREPRRTGLTLIISTGGSGITAIKQAIRVANQKLQPDYANYVKFIAVDSSTGEIEYLKRIGIDCVNTSSPGIDNRILRTNRNSFYKTFVPADYDITFLNSDGASQDRMTGKIKLYDQYGGTTIDQILREKIEALFANEWKSYANLPVDIMILSGLSGGNGSGTFLDIAAIARHSIPLYNSVRVYGYLMLPDTAERFAASPSAKNSLYRNGFAALKELESYMSLSMDTDRHELFPSNSMPNSIIVSATRPLYDYPVLISGDYDSAVTLIAETIVNSIADTEGKFEQRAFYSNNLSYRSVAVCKNEMMNMGVLKNGACPEDSHLYCGIGFAEASIPEKIVIPNLVSKVIEQIYCGGKDSTVGIDSLTRFCTGERRLKRYEFEQCMKILLGMDTRTPLTNGCLLNKVQHLINTATTLPANNYEISYNDILSGSTKDYLRGFQVDRTVEKALVSLPKLLDNLYRQIIEGARKVMSSYGPRALIYLFDGRGDNDKNGVPEDYSDICLRKQIEIVEAALIQWAGMTPQYPIREDKRGLFDFLYSKKILEEWTIAAQRAAHMNVIQKVALRMTGRNGVWRNSFVDSINNFLKMAERFSIVVESLSTYYAGVGSSLNEDDYRRFSGALDSANSVNLCNNEDVFRWIRNSIDAKVNAIDYSEARKILIDDFINRSESWCSDNRGSARHCFDDVLSRICCIGIYSGETDGLNLTITDYFEEKVRIVPQNSQNTIIENEVEDIMARLLQQSRPSLELRENASSHINKVILLPNKILTGPHGTLIFKSFQKMIGDGDTLAVSSVVDSVVCYQASVAQGLCDLKHLDLWENGYEAALSNTTHLNNGEYVSLHMQTGVSQYKELSRTETARLESGKDVSNQLSSGDEIIYGTGLSWVHYPSVNLLRYQDDFKGSATTAEGEYRRGPFNAKIQRALDLKIIECEGNEGIYKYYLNTLPNDWKDLDVQTYSTVDSDGFLKRGFELFEYLQMKNTSSSSTWRKQICLRNSEAFGSDGFDFREIQRNENWSDERIESTHRSYMKRIMRKAVGLYQELEDTLYRFCDIELALVERDKSVEEKKAQDRKKNRVRNFAKGIMYGVIETPDNGNTWNISLNKNNSPLEIVYFSRRLRMGFDTFESAAYANSLKLLLVYKGYLKMIEKGQLGEKSFELALSRMQETMSDKAFDKLLDRTIPILEKECHYFRELVGSSRDETDALMNALGLDDSQFDATEDAVMFYREIELILGDLSL